MLSISHVVWFAVLCAFLLSTSAFAASNCSTSLTPKNGVKPSVASGYQVALVATGLTKPRTIRFDSAGNLLVLQQGAGVANLVFQDGGGTCLSVKSKTDVIEDKNLNHGLALSGDGSTLYASSSDAAFSWTYDPENASIGGSRTTLVTGMANDDHTTRTLLISQKVNGILLVSRGSTSNIDAEASELATGHSQIKAYNVSNMTDGPYNFSRDGLRLGWGLRNSVGLAEHPDTGGIYSVENSVDEMRRNGKDIHQDNPGEEMNFHGYLNGTTYSAQGSNYGYPGCFAAWKVDEIPNNGNLTVGSQFAIDNQYGVDDAFCAQQIAPRITFQAHMAPLDIVFNDSGKEAWVSFHGSWDRSSAVGYKLSVIPFSGGQPVAAPNNNTAATDILTNANNSACPKQCLRPVGIAFDKQGRLFLSSDSTGEIYVVVKDQASSTTTTATPTTLTFSPSSSKSHAEKEQAHYSTGVLIIASLICLFVL